MTPIRKRSARSSTDPAYLLTVSMVARAFGISRQALYGRKPVMQLARCRPGESRLRWRLADLEAAGGFVHDALYKASELEKVLDLEAGALKQCPSTAMGAGKRYRLPEVMRWLRKTA